jgi:hypothetical protein
MPATVDADTFTCDEIAIEQKEHRFSDFRGSAPSPKRRGIDRFGVLLWSQVRRRQDRSRRDRLDQYFRSQLQCETLSQRENSGFGRVVGTKPLYRGRPLTGSQSAKLMMRAPSPPCLMVGAAQVEKRKTLRAFASMVSDQSASLGSGMCT